MKRAFAASGIRSFTSIVLLLGMLVLCPGGAWAGPLAYTANQFDNTVSVIDTASNAVTATVTVVGDLPFEIAVTPDGAHVYVTNTNTNDNTVSVIDTASNALTATVTVGSFPVGVAVTPDGAHVYVTNLFDNTVSVIDTASNAVTATVTVGNAPAGIAVTPDGAHVYVTNLFDNTVSVIDTASNTVTTTVTVGQGPFAIAIGPSSQQRIEQLVLQIGGAGIQSGLAQSLASKLDAALDSLARGDTGSAVNQLRAFEHEVSAQSGKKIPGALASAWIALVEGIIANL